MKAPVLEEFKMLERACGGGNTADAPHTLEVCYGLRVIGKQAPYFSITAAEKTYYGTWIVGGCLHDDIGRVFPELAHLIKWHLTAWGKGPMHYIANAVYWAEKMYGVSGWVAMNNEPNPTKAFQSTVVYGAVEGDIMPVWTPLDASGYDRLEMRLITPQNARAEVRAVIEEWCKARFDRLMQAFEHDMALAGLVKEV